jgi:hypothetical protein
MSIADWLTIAAVLLGPIIAVRVTRYLDDRKEIRERKLWIFKTLMATRGYIVSPLHVEALNRIDLEFDRKSPRERAVLDAWKEYLDLLNNSLMSAEQWNLKRIDLLVELLHKMAQILVYDFDKTHIKNSLYVPRAHGDLEEQLAAIRKGLIELLEGKRVLPVNVSDRPPGGQI